MNDRNNMILGGNTNLASAERMVGLRVCGNTKKNYGAKKLNTMKIYINKLRQYKEHIQKRNKKTQIKDNIQTYI